MLGSLRWEFKKENKKVRKQENKNSTRKAIKKTRKKRKQERTFFLSWSLSWSRSCFLTFLFSFINSHFRKMQNMNLFPSTSFLTHLSRYLLEWIKIYTCMRHSQDWKEPILINGFGMPISHRLSHLSILLSCFLLHFVRWLPKRDGSFFGIHVS